MRTEAEIRAKVAELGAEIDELSIRQLGQIAIRGAAKRVLEWTLEAPAEVDQHGRPLHAGHSEPACADPDCQQHVR